jgi:hypothetical protein
VAVHGPANGLRGGPPLGELSGGHRRFCARLSHARPCVAAGRVRAARAPRAPLAVNGHKVGEVGLDHLAGVVESLRCAATVAPPARISIAERHAGGSAPRAVYGLGCGSPLPAAAPSK